MRRLALLSAGVLVLLFGIPSHGAERAPAATWCVTQNGNILQIGYGSSADCPQYAALHLDSSYFRLNYGPISGWGTSIVLVPPFWSGGTYYQGTPVTATHRVDGHDLVLWTTGAISTLTGVLTSSSEVRLLPPVENVLLTAQVTTTVTISGSVPLDERSGEAFKPVMLSSMHVSSTLWDTRAAFADCHYFPIPDSGWIIHPPVVARRFGLLGGTSAWKTNASTIEILLDRPMPVTGWVASSNDPNDDNVALWAAADAILPSWSYTIIAAGGTERSLPVSARHFPELRSGFNASGLGHGDDSTCAATRRAHQLQRRLTHRAQRPRRPPRARTPRRHTQRHRDADADLYAHPARADSPGGREWNRRWASDAALGGVGFQDGLAPCRRVPKLAVLVALRCSLFLERPVQQR